MAQTQSPTSESFGEIGKHMAGEASSAFYSVGCIKDSPCVADETWTAAGTTWCTEIGLVLVAADAVYTVTTVAADDTVRVDHIFSAGEVASVTGFGVCNVEMDVMFGVCCFAATIPMEDTDTITIELKAQFKKA